MKAPNIKDLKIDWEGTKAMRRLAARSKKIKITINIDSDVLSEIRNLAGKGGSPYQSYLNLLLRQALAQKATEEARLDRLEKEVALIKKKIAA